MPLLHTLPVNGGGGTVGVFPPGGVTDAYRAAAPGSRHCILYGLSAAPWLSVSKLNATRTELKPSAPMRQTTVRKSRVCASVPA